MSHLKRKLVRNFSTRCLYSQLTKKDIDLIVEYIMIWTFYQQIMN